MKPQSGKSIKLQNFHRFSNEGPKTHQGFGDLTLKLINVVTILFKSDSFGWYMSYRRKDH